MSVDVYRVKVKKSKTYQLLSPAIAELGRSLEVMKVNEPINRKEGNKAQAELEKDNATSYKAAIDRLKAWQ